MTTLVSRTAATGAAGASRNACEDHEERAEGGERG